MFCGAPGWLWAAQAPVAYEAVYELRQNGLLIGQTNQRLQYLPDGRLLLVSRSSAVGLARLFRPDVITESSWWNLVEGRPQPQAYRYEHTGSDKDRNVALDFDWQQKRVHNHVRGSHWQMEIPKGTLDKQLTSITLMMDAADGAEVYRYPVADGGRLKTYEFERDGKAELALPGGRFQTEMFIRRKQGSERVTRVWLAPSLRHLPVQIERERNGKTFVMQLIGLPQPPLPGAP